jgi:hypothetical protein
MAKILNRVPRHSERASWSVFDDEVVVLDTRRRVMMGLNPSAGLIWDLLDDQRSARAVGERVADHFNQPLETVLPDAAAFLELLEEKELVRLRPAESDEPSPLPSRDEPSPSDEPSLLPPNPPDNDVPYAPPAVAWQESLEEAGVFTACSKGVFGPWAQCSSSPSSGTS